MTGFRGAGSAGDSDALRPAAEVTLDFSASRPSRPAFADFTGVISGPAQPIDSPAPDLTARLQSIGVSAIRNNDYYDDRLDIEGIFNCRGATYPSWTGCDPEDEANYSWGPSDALMAGITKGGFEPFLRLGGEWQDQEHKHEYKGPRDAAEEDAWIIAAKRVARRYSAQTTWLDVWTEIPGEHFWGRSLPEFEAFWIKAYASIKADFPEKKVGGPGLGAGISMQVAQGSTRNLAVTLLAGLYGKGIAPDWLGWHLFGNNPAIYVNAQHGYEDLLVGRGAFSTVPWAGTGFFAHTELVLDAYGLNEGRTKDSPGLPPEEVAQLFNGGRGAATIASTWIGLQETTVVRAFYYRAGDPRSAPGAEPAHPGLFYGDATATPKPLANAMRLWNTLRTRYGTVLGLTRTPGGHPLVAALGESNGSYAVLVANNTPTATSWDLKLPSGKAFAAFKSRSVQIVDDTHDGITPAPLAADGPVSIPAWCVELVILSG